MRIFIAEGKRRGGCVLFATTVTRGFVKEGCAACGRANAAPVADIRMISAARRYYNDSAVVR